MLYLNTFSRVPDLVDLLFHLVEISGQSNLVLVVSQLKVLETFGKLFLLMSLRCLCFLIDFIFVYVKCKAVCHFFHLNFHSLKLVFSIGNLFYQHRIIQRFWWLPILLKISHMALISL